MPPVLFFFAASSNVQACSPVHLPSVNEFGLRLSVSSTCPSLPVSHRSDGLGRPWASRRACIGVAAVHGGNSAGGGPPGRRSGARQLYFRRAARWQAEWPPTNADDAAPPLLGFTSQPSRTLDCLSRCRHPSHTTTGSYDTQLAAIGDYGSGTAEEGEVAAMIAGFAPVNDILALGDNNYVFGEKEERQPGAVDQVPNVTGRHELDSEPAAALPTRAVAQLPAVPPWQTLAPGSGSCHPTRRTVISLRAAGKNDTIDANIGQFFSSYISPYQGSYGNGSTTGNHFWPIPGA